MTLASVIAEVITGLAFGLIGGLLYVALHNLWLTWRQR